VILKQFGAFVCKESFIGKLVMIRRAPITNNCCVFDFIIMLNFVLKNTLISEDVSFSAFTWAILYLDSLDFFSFEKKWS